MAECPIKKSHFKQLGGFLLKSQFTDVRINAVQKSHIGNACFCRKTEFECAWTFSSKASRPKALQVFPQISGYFLDYLEFCEIYLENLGIFRNIHSFLFGLALCFPPIPLKQDSDGFMPQTIQFSDFPREKCFPYQSKHGRTKFQKWRILVTSKGPNLLHSSHYKTF